MKRIEDTPAFLEMAKAKERRILVRDLTDALEDLFMVPEGRKLAFRLGYPRAKSNREALRTWVEANTDNLAGLTFEETLAFLEREFRTSFSD